MKWLIPGNVTDEGARVRGHQDEDDDPDPQSNAHPIQKNLSWKTSGMIKDKLHQIFSYLFIYSHLWPVLDLYIHSCTKESIFFQDLQEIFVSKQKYEGILIVTG